MTAEERELRGTRRPKERLFAAFSLAAVMTPSNLIAARTKTLVMANLGPVPLVATPTFGAGNT